ncbi:hypothetical protein [Kitasatospora sp. NPDC005751]|uniref:hypothetical protein n=1 Tax=Kitasatospora sp. NPDC005751 TaxID=3157064 RepID=UPI0033F9103B
MGVDWCERCEMSWCDCPADGSVPRLDRAMAVLGATWAGWPTGATAIVSPTGYAHLPGCFHLTESVLAAPRYGWVTEPVSGHHVTRAQPLRATAGNRDRIATKSCPTCFE